MQKSIRDVRQEEFADVWVNSNKKGILLLAPRFGKIRTTIHIFNKIKPKSILIAYPDNKIRQSWEDDFEAVGYDSSNVTFTTHLSLKKYCENTYDVVVIDEIHLLSEAQMEAAKDLLSRNKRVVGLTGTLSKPTEIELFHQLGMSVIARYPIEKAIEEGIIVDYEIRVVKVPLDNLTKVKYKDKLRTEKEQFDTYSWVINKLEREGKNTMFPRLARMRIIQSSSAKLNATKKILKNYSDKRVLVFCGVTKIADSLGIPSYHSKSNEKQLFEDFASGKGNHMAVIKIGNTGITYTPLNMVIINYFDSNAENLAQKIMRCTAFEYNNVEKKAYIYIVSTDEEIEQRWLTKALSLFDKNKIKYINEKTN
jgi:superfamily II DNA or RNA helicase